MRGLQVWSEGRKRRVGAALKGLPWVARGGKHGKGAAAADQTLIARDDLWIIAVTFESKSCNNKLYLDSVTRPLHSPDGPKPPCNDSARQRK